MRILGAYILVYAPGLVASQYTISSHRDKLYLASVLCGGVCSVVLSLILVPRWGRTGAALCVLLGHGLANEIYWLVVLTDLSSQRDGVRMVLGESIVRKGLL